jgi:hypothetical protein
MQDGVELVDPYIRLLTYGHVDGPLSLLVDESLEGCRVAICLAMKVSFFVLAIEVENVDWLPCICKVCITNLLLISIQLAVVVKDEILWDTLRGGKGTFGKVLEAKS